MKDTTYIFTTILFIIALILVVAIFIFLCGPLNQAYEQISAKQCSDANGTYTMEQGCISSNGSRILNTINISGSQKSHYAQDLNSPVRKE